MKITEPTWSPYSKELNQDGVDNPQVGDYWHERFCPYFCVVEVNGKDITVLSCLSSCNINAKIDNKDGTWSLDYTKHMVVDRDWIRDLVTYKSIPGFCADVVRKGPNSTIAVEWRSYKCELLYNQWTAIKKEWEDLSGLTYIIKDINT
jgi:hypothetical protein